MNYLSQVLVEYSLEDQISDISKHAGISATETRKIMKVQRRMVQKLIAEGRAVNMEGVFSVGPIKWGDKYALSAEVDSSVKRDMDIKKRIREIEDDIVIFEDPDFD